MTAGLEQRLPGGEHRLECVVGEPGLLVVLDVEVVVDADERVRAVGAVGLGDEAGSEVDDRLLAVTGRRHVAVGAAQRRRRACCEDRP